MKVTDLEKKNMIKFPETKHDSGELCCAASAFYLMFAVPIAYAE